MNKTTELLNSPEFKKMKEIQLDLLEKITVICKQHNIRYYAVYGTLLGAVRHQGYIPWDDDIDIAIYRKDVKKLKQIAETELEYPYKLLFSDERHDFYCGIIRFQNLDSSLIDLDFFSEKGFNGISIDIEIIDFTFANTKLLAIKHSVLELIYEIIFMKQYGMGYYGIRWKSQKRKKIVKLLSGILNRTILIKLSEWIQSLHGWSQEYCSIYTYRQYHHLKLEWFEDGVERDFENLSIIIPTQFEKCLTAFYGEDYYVIPKQENQKPSHLSGFKYLAPYCNSKEATYTVTGFLQASKGKRRIVWGAGNMLEHFMAHFGDIYTPEYIIDNNETLWGQKKHDCEICSPQVLLHFEPHEVHIIICNIYYREIIQQLSQMGDFTYSIYWENYINRINQ